jgi:hypothetical protein
MKTVALLLVSGVGILVTLICGAATGWYVLAAIFKLVGLHPVAAVGRLLWAAVLAFAAWCGWKVATRSLNAIGSED